MKRRRNSDSNIGSSRDSSVKRAMFHDEEKSRDSLTVNRTSTSSIPCLYSDSSTTLHGSKLVSDSIIAPATRLGASSQCSSASKSATTVASEKNTSLFGTVMKNVGTPCKTPKKRPALDLGDLNSPFVSTPFVSTPGSVYANADDWHEEPLDSLSWDWTLKETVSLELHPSQTPLLNVSYKSFPVFAGKQPSDDPLVNLYSSLLHYSYESVDKEGWKESFQSLFRIWLDTVQSQTKLDRNAYFYCIGRGSTVLFRPTLVQNTVHPEIVVSCSTTYLRQMLRQAGVKLYLLNKWNGTTGEFTEDLLQIKPENQKSSNSSSPDVKSELKELRQAQINGHTVGADISVLDVLPQLQTSAIPSLYCRGEDDCLAFFEVYFNCTGCLRRTERSEYPTILCRFSPFLNCTVQSLDISSINGGFQVTGRVLPCARAQLLQSCVEMLKQHAEQHPPTSPDDDTVGTHHLVLRNTVLDNEVSGLSCIGNASSRYFNHNDETPNIIIWDINRPDSIAYQLMGVTGTLLGGD